LIGVTMKPQAKMLVLMLGLMLPYLGFVLFRVFTFHRHPFPSWFLYVGPCYFFGSIALAVVLRKRLVAITPSQGTERGTPSATDIDVDRRRLKGLWIGVGIYSLIFLNGLRLGLAYLGELPIVVIILAEALNAAILATFVLSLRKVYTRIPQADRSASDR
jgi:hypothetical protein